MEKSRKKDFIFLLVLISLFFLINYSSLDGLLVNFFDEYETAVAARIIDGDTIELDTTEHVRLLGIDTPERGEIYSVEATNFLKGKILNKTVQLKFGKDRYDLYDRKLAYVFINGENANLELVKNGLANFYFPSGKDQYYDEFKSAWESCVEKNINLCEVSKNVCAVCIELKEFNHENEEIVFYNSCSSTCDLTNWEIEDEGRKNFIFGNFELNSGEEVAIITGEENDTGDILFWRGEEYVWTDTGDTLFLRDDEGKLVLWESY